MNQIKMLINIENLDLEVEENEFSILSIDKYNTLNIRKNLGLYERLISFIEEITKRLGIKTCLYMEPTHGGFLPLKCSKFVENNYVYSTNNKILNNAFVNKCLNINFNFFLSDEQIIIYEKINVNLIEESLVKNNKSIVLCGENNYFNNLYDNKLNLTNTGYFIYFNNNQSVFYNKFSNYICGNSIKYDNLLNVCIMVKDAGDIFEKMLLGNLDIIDRWTILDTGSTDNTLDIINNVLVGKKDGNLYQEPFINFRDSRNRLLDLAGNSCKYNIMLDDTYVVKGDLRKFLSTIRGDDVADSFTMFIKSDDTEYGSNRIVKSSKNLRYKYKIHEVIDPDNNKNIMIPKENSNIDDLKNDYMQDRTMGRKELDIKLLLEEINDDPENPRSYYYLAQTYNLLKKYELSYEYFQKRVSMSGGFIQEKFDAAFEAARIYNFKLNKPWEECVKLYNIAYEIDKTRPEPLYFLGIHYYLENNFIEAYKYFKEAFKVGYPSHTQYSLKPTLSFHFLPYFLTRVCYIVEDYILGQSVSEFYLIHNKDKKDDLYSEIVSWYTIYLKINKIKVFNTPVDNSDKPIFCFVADGGFKKWSGRDILTSGVGGSETYIIEMARYFEKIGHFNVFVFCNCEESDIFEGVNYEPLETYFDFINNNYVNSVMISRYSEYLPVTYKSYTENVYFVIHDLTPSGSVLVKDKKLKKVFCLTEWHVEHFTEKYPNFKDITVPFYYGIDVTKFNLSNIKNAYKFIYSSFPNRGLLQLLQMWPLIYNKEPLANLHIYSNVHQEWVNNVEPKMMEEIKILLKKYSKMNIFYHGWVDKKTLADAWKSSDIWLYPCTFMETFCLTALEAAITKTLIFTNDLAALQNTVGNRGVIVKGEATSNEWQNSMIQEIFKYMDSKDKTNYKNLINKNYDWASNMSWENQASKLHDLILPNSFEYKKDTFWNDNLPILTEVLKYFVANSKSLKKKFLQIGCGNGNTIINLLKIIPNSTATCIDSFSNEYKEYNLLGDIRSLHIKKSFIRNIKLTNTNNRITYIDQEEIDGLLQLIQTFDFIYHNQEKHYLDLYSEIILCWKKLNKSGILGFSIYPSTDILVVNKFLEKYKDKYKLLLNKSNMIFLQKIS